MTPIRRKFTNVGWSLGNYCPFKCAHCYSRSARAEGKFLTIANVDHIVAELANIGVRAVTLGGNEPLYTHGANVQKSLLPYIIKKLSEVNISPTIVSSGPSIVGMYKYFRSELELVQHISVSVDSANADAHNENRKSLLFPVVLRALEICNDLGIPRTILNCGMNWNFDETNLSLLLELATRTNALVRINPIKLSSAELNRFDLSPTQYFKGFAFLMRQCKTLECSESPLATATTCVSPKPCPCGVTSFRINPIAPDGRITVAPCMYLHHLNCGNLARDNLRQIIEESYIFEQFRMRQRYFTSEYQDNGFTKRSFGGCAARGYMSETIAGNAPSLLAIDPLAVEHRELDYGLSATLGSSSDVECFRDYLCTWIGSPM